MLKPVKYIINSFIALLYTMFTGFTSFTSILLCRGTIGCISAVIKPLYKKKVVKPV